MTKKTIITSAERTGAMESFENREVLMFRGVLVLLTSLLEDYLTGDQIQRLAYMMRRLRQRPVNVKFSEELCEVISDSDTLCHLRIPSKRICREELATLLYHVSPYCIINRKQTAVLAKCAFPNFFPSVTTIYTIFNRRQVMPHPSPFSTFKIKVPDFQEHTVESVEKEMVLLGGAVRMRI